MPAKTKRKWIAPSVKCPHCRGLGRMPITGVYAETLRVVLFNPGRNGAELAKLMGCKNEAMCNRLRRLEQLRLVESTPFGRQVTWTVK